MMKTSLRKWSGTICVAALATMLATASALLAGKGGKQPPPSDPPPSYTMTRLGTLGGPSSEASAMNQWGDVAGTSQIPVTNENGETTFESTPFVYFADTGKMVDLRSMLSQADLDAWQWRWFRPNAFNAGGQLCGGGRTVDANGETLHYAIRITLPDTPTDTALVEIVGPRDSSANDINELGEMTGFYIGEDGTYRGFVYSDSLGFQDIGDLGGTSTAGYAINNLGEVAGYSENADRDRHAIRYVPGQGLQDLGVIKKAGRVFFGYNNSYAHALNDNGQLAGQSIAGMVNGYPVDRAFLDSGNGLQNLGVLSGDENSGAMSVNSSGTVAGWSEGRDSRWRGFVYDSRHGMLEVDSLITNMPAGIDGIISMRLFKLNDAGMICGTLNYTDESHQLAFEAYVLTPASP